ncbi:hypothetical protein ACERII_09805 [Evansella sp. AB-rgal1]|uniref:hypothetical protein n=1 Tax=Evansella sp. AB-rgal1 TaxID=3242696 RepID=UPI00359E1785
MPQGDIALITILSLMFVFIVGVVLLIVLWFKSSYREKDIKIKELKREIEELKKRTSS